MWKTIDIKSKKQYNKDTNKRKGCYQCTGKYKPNDLILSEIIKIKQKIMVIKQVTVVPLAKCKSSGKE